LVGRQGLEADRAPPFAASLDTSLAATISACAPSGHRGRRGLFSALDRDTLVASVRKTGRAVVVHEAPQSFGPGAGIATSIMEGAFLSLEALIKRVAGCDLSFVGFAREKMNVPDLARVVAAARQTLAY
jgi:pyruvate/2-oxoglutarate/acetoin dehydrogenase E1 component